MERAYQYEAKRLQQERLKARKPVRKEFQAEINRLKQMLEERYCLADKDFQGCASSVEADNNNASTLDASIINHRGFLCGFYDETQQDGKYSVSSDHMGNSKQRRSYQQGSSKSLKPESDEAVGRKDDTGSGGCHTLLTYYFFQP